MMLEKHGTVLLLYSLVLLMAGATLYIGLHTPPNDKLFEWAAGFTGGAFSGLTVAMKVAGNGSTPAPSPDPQPKA